MLDLTIKKQFASQKILNTLTPQEEQIIGSDEFTRNYSLLLSKCQIQSPDDYLSGDGICGKIMKTFLDIYSKYPESMDDASFIINKYIAMIEQSNVLTDQEKELVYSGLAVGAYSFDYCEKNF